LEANESGKRIISDISSELNENGYAEVRENSSYSIATSSQERSLVSSNTDINHQLNLLARQEPKTITSNTMVFSRHERKCHASVLRHDPEAGTVVMRKVSEDRIAQEQHLTLLPISKTLQDSFSTLMTSLGNPENIHLLINKAAQEVYAVDDVSDFSLPALLVRKEQSIPSVAWRMPTFQLEDRGQIAKRRRLQ